MKYLAIAAATLVFAANSPAIADQILAFGQTGKVNDVSLIDNGGVSTTLLATDVPVTITEIFGGSEVDAFLDLNATSTNAATTLGSGFQQSYSGSFSLTSAAGGSGINFLSGMFTDMAIGLDTILVVASSDPPDSITLSSDVIPTSEFGLPLGVGFSLSNVDPALKLDGQTLSGGTASLTGTFNATPIPEPASLAVLGVGVAGLGYIRRSRRTA